MRTPNMVRTGIYGVNVSKGWWSSQLQKTERTWSSDKDVFLSSSHRSEVTAPTVVNFRLCLLSSDCGVLC